MLKVSPLILKLKFTFRFTAIVVCVIVAVGVVLPHSVIYHACKFLRLLDTKLSLLYAVFNDLKLGCFSPIGLCFTLCDGY